MPPIGSNTAQGMCNRVQTDMLKKKNTAYYCDSFIKVITKHQVRQEKMEMYFFLEKKIPAIVSAGPGPSRVGCWSKYWCTKAKGYGAI